MHLSANEIDLQFQYRYANQVRVSLAFRTCVTLTSLATVPESYPPRSGWTNQPETAGYSQVQA